MNHFLMKDELRNIKSPRVDFAVCGRFHFHKYIKYLYERGALSVFMYSYRLNYNFGVPEKKLKNYFLKEYLLYFGMRFLKGKRFYFYISFLHHLWQWQVMQLQPSGNVLHVLIHGNSADVIRKYKKQGIPVIGEVVNAHPVVQEQLLQKEYGTHQLTYSYGENVFKEKMINEISLCDYLLVPSGFIKQSLLSNGIDGKKIKVLPYGIDAVGSRKESSFIRKESVVKLLYIGQISFRKGVIYLLKALSLLKNSGLLFHLTLVGHVDNEYKNIIQPYLTLPEISYLPHVDNTEVYELMKKHDLLIMPSIEDGFGVVVSEALSVHLPVILTKNCGSSEIVTHGREGFVINAFSEMDIYQAIVESIGYNFTFKDENRDWKQYVAELEEFYTDILK